MKTKIIIGVCIASVFLLAIGAVASASKTTTNTVVPTPTVTVTKTQVAVPDPTEVTGQDWTVTITPN